MPFYGNVADVVHGHGRNGQCGIDKLIFFFFFSVHLSIVTDQELWSSKSRRLEKEAIL